MDSLDEKSDDTGVLILQGKGWKLGIDQTPSSTSSEEYTAFVGGDDWRILLTNTEFNDFIQLLKDLRSA